ncbi:Photosystem II reaction center W protein, chloroplastic [Triticum urartu]|uniref:PSII 6.1 kDa protein n=1 Tax=Triticum urartu TaxID=4572 RepID=M7ZY91_TRIUA|nr:Photosystem II reaction center W protein, chloroplastic [Triticum urartu]
MATISATTVGFAARPSPAAGLPQLRVARAARLRCSSSKDHKKAASSAVAPAVAKGARLLVAAPALLEVDERMSAERTWLGDSLLGWILLGAVGLVLSFHSVYSYILDDGHQSGSTL